MGKVKFLPKLGFFLLVIVLSILLSCIYGIIHDTITYSISPEYYTKYKFIQFGLISEPMENTVIKPFVLVILTGIIATWWMGLLFGLILGTLNLIYFNSFKQNVIIYFRLVAILFITTTIAAFIGYFIGIYTFTGKEFYFHFTENILNKRDYHTVGMIHNLSYIGAVVGIILSLLKFRGLRKSISNF